MTPADFHRTLSLTAPPAALAAPLAALWWVRRGDWGKAHRLVMDEASREAAWVHAYLHRVEGDSGNADYWYAQARRKSGHGDLDTEWEMIVEALLGR